MDLIHFFMVCASDRVVFFNALYSIKRKIAAKTKIIEFRFSYSNFSRAGNNILRRYSPVSARSDRPQHHGRRYHTAQVGRLS